MSADVHLLTGAYALDAVPASELEAFERHVADCDVCRREVVELTETAAALAAEAALPVPPSLRHAVVSAVDEVRQVAPSAGSRPRPRRVLFPVAAALAAAVLGLGAIAVGQQRQIDALQQVASDGAPAAGAVAVALAAEDAELVALRTDTGAAVRLVWSSDRDHAVLAAEGLPAVEPGRRYELWLYHDGVPVAVGGFRPDADGRATAVVQGSVAGATQAAITVEPEGPAHRPTGPVVASAPLV